MGSKKLKLTVERKPPFYIIETKKDGLRHLELKTKRWLRVYSKVAEIMDEFFLECGD